MKYPQSLGRPLKCSICNLTPEFAPQPVCWKIGDGLENLGPGLNMPTLRLCRHKWHGHSCRQDPAVCGCWRLPPRALPACPAGRGHRQQGTPGRQVLPGAFCTNEGFTPYEPLERGWKAKQKGNACAPPCMHCATTVSLFEHPRPVFRAASYTQYHSALLHAGLSRVLNSRRAQRANSSPAARDIL